MKRFALVLGTFALATQLFGCSSSAPPPADESNLPSEVKEYEARREAERTKKIVPKAPPRDKSNDPR